MFLVWKCAVWRRCRSSRSARWPREGSGVAGTAAERGSTPVRRTSLTTNDECTGPNRCDEVAVGGGLERQDGRGVVGQVVDEEDVGALAQGAHEGLGGVGRIDGGVDERVDCV